MGFKNLLLLALTLFVIYDEHCSKYPPQGRKNKKK